ncbi:hypothetical protein [Streptomyces sp. NPDC049879]|uniref:hypothetical protein n=1 Tax=Streptomyces sp. NPDC049879 TaxID=3365598 RepID=UPI0037A27EB3
MADNEPGNWSVNPWPAFFEGEIGKTPWADTDTFVAEIDPGQMAEHATVYARAAGEAGTASDLARIATQRAGEAGTADGDPLIGMGERISVTDRDLQQGDGGLDDVVHLLVRVMNLAVDTEKRVYETVYGDGGLDDTRKEAVREAQNHIQNMEAAFEYAQESSVRGRVGNEGESMSVEGIMRGWREEAEKRMVERMTDPVTTAAEKVRGEIDGYQAKLLDYGAELIGHGYRLTEGPLKLWTSPFMAEHAARGVAWELAHGADRSKLADLTSVLGEITARAGRLGEGEELSPEEMTYLSAFLNQLGQKGVVRLGELQPDATAMSPGAVALDREAVRNVANAWNLLGDPRFDWQGRHDTYWTDFMIDPDIGATEENVRNLNAVGHLLAEATVPPHEGWAMNTAKTAVEIQADWEDRHRDGRDGGGPAFTGASDVLRNAARSETGAQQLLDDEEFRDNLLSRTWQDSSGAAALIDGGTREARSVRDFAVLGTMDSHKDEIAGSSDGAEHSALRDSVDRLKERWGQD